MPFDQNATQQLAALVAVVSIAILGVAFLLVPSVWKGVKSTSICLATPQKRLIRRNLVLYYGPFVISLLIIDFFGVYIPPLVVPILKILFLVLPVLWIAINIIHQWKERRSKTPPTKIEPIPFSYRSTLVWLGLCVFFCLFALVGVVYPMLNIEIGPSTQENYNWARWFLINGTTSFVVSIISFATTIVVTRQENSQNNEEPTHPKRSFIRWIPVLVSLIVLLVMSVVFSPKGYGIDDFLSWPLNADGNVKFSGTQFIIENDSNFDWEDITFSIDKGGLSSGYTLEIPQLKQGETFTVDADEFSNNEGIRFDPATVKPLQLTIEMKDSLGRLGIGYATFKLLETSYSIKTQEQSIPIVVKATVHFSGTQFMITNLSEFDWTETTFYINKQTSDSGYYFSVSSLLQGDSITVDASDFVNDEGLKFNPTTIKPVTFTIETQNDVGQTGVYSGIFK